MFLAYLRKLKGTRFSCVGGGLRLGSAIWPSMKLVRAGKAEPLCSSMSSLKRWTRSGATPPNLLLSTIGRVPARPRPRREMATVRRAELDVALLLLSAMAARACLTISFLKLLRRWMGWLGFSAVAHSASMALWSSLSSATWLGILNLKPFSIPLGWKMRRTGLWSVRAAIPFSGFALAAIGRGSTSHEGFMMVCSEVECE